MGSRVLRALAAMIGIVAVEDTSEGAVAVLAEPAGDRPGAQAPMDRFVLHEHVQYLIWSDPHPLAFREEVEALLAARAPIEVELHVDGCGRITLLSLDPMAM